jgi:hypothetical protein
MSETGRGQPVDPIETKFRGDGWGTIHKPAEVKVERFAAEIELLGNFAFTQMRSQRRISRYPVVLKRFFAANATRSYAQCRLCDLHSLPCLDHRAVVSGPAVYQQKR